MTVRVRMAPSPTGFLHIGGVHTFLFNWLFARGRGGECLLRIENTDTSREVTEAVDQIQRSLSWIGIDWDGPVTFQLDAMERCRELAAKLVAEGTAYEDEGAIRFRMPDDGSTGWDDAVRGRIEVPNAQLEDVVIVRSDGRATYNFASPVEDMDDAITHVIRGEDHISNTPKQIQILRALTPEGYADRLLVFLRDQGTDWDEARVRAAAPLVQEKIGRLEEFRGMVGFLFGFVDPDVALLDPAILAAAAKALDPVDPWVAPGIEVALKTLCEELGRKPKDVFLPIRVAVTGSRVSPGLYESLELLGKDTSLARIRAHAATQ